MRPPDIAVLGGGLLGRCVAWRAAKAGASVAIYDAAGPDGERSAAWGAAGMIAPVSEAIGADPQIESIGRRSLALWPQWIGELPVPVFYRDCGTLLLWHREDEAEPRRIERVLAARGGQTCLRRISSAEIQKLDPVMGTRFQPPFISAVRRRLIIGPS